MIVPCRERPSGFGITRNRTSPLPWPADGESSVIQLTPAAAVHVHSGVVVIANVCCAPTAATESPEAATEISHFAGVGPVTVEVDVFPHAVMTISVPSAPPYTQRRCTLRTTRRERDTSSTVRFPSHRNGLRINRNDVATMTSPRVGARPMKR